jgi:hypothetical protein
MARKGELTADSTPEEIEAHTRKLLAGIDDMFRKARGQRAAARSALPERIEPRPTLHRFAPENIERLLRIIESAPSAEELGAFMKRAERTRARRMSVGTFAQRALNKCRDYYATEHPGCDPENLAEVKAIRRFIRQQRSDAAADMWDIRRKLHYLRGIASARAELQAIKDEFNKLGNDNQSTTP